MYRNLIAGLLFGSLPLFAGVALPPMERIHAEEQSSETPHFSPEEAARQFETPDDLNVELVLAEPVIEQPIFLNFDERGRMWVVQYRQYPYPAGLKMLSRDKYWRAVYDKIPPPPPNHIRGRDRITIHEDTTGDGRFDKQTTFLEGLNIATSCVRGRGGVWVLNPPYLLFYPDKDNDDVPDSDPEVHLEGFGLEDTHSVVNSLRWGPDGWLYAAQGSTVSGNVRRPGLDKEGRYSMGQLIWRYHPETRRYEVFAEGGGNAFGVEFDAQGRVYSGHNGGNTRGFHYVQGGYYQKGFSKHGPLSNPYSFGYFPAMKHDNVPRFTHNFIIYEADTLPDEARGRLFGIEPLQGRIVESDLQRDRSSFQTEDLSHPIQTADKRFRPVDIKVGPDGAIYFADMYEDQIAHGQHFQGNINKDDGRIYRLQAKNAPPAERFDLNEKTTAELVELLAHPNKWFRQTALRLIGDRKDASIIPTLKDLVLAERGQRALDGLWALNLSGGLDEPFALKALEHPNPQVQLWTVRLLGDENEVSPAVAGVLIEMAKNAESVEVRSQLASTAKRLPAEQGLPVVRELLSRSEDVGDIHLPLLLWWAIESNCGPQADQVMAVFEESAVWEFPLVRQHILQRLMRRFAMTDSRRDLLFCARLLKHAPDEEATQRLMSGFEEAYKGRSLAGLPEELAEALTAAGGGSLALRVRGGDDAARQDALKRIADPHTDVQERLDYVLVFGELRHPEGVPVLLDVLRTSADDELRSGVLTALQSYNDPKIGEAVLKLYEQFTPDVRTVAQTLLVSRSSWALQLLTAIDREQIEKGSIPVDVIRQATAHRDERIGELIQKHWGTIDGATTAEMQAEIARLLPIVTSGSGDPYEGKKQYEKTCAKCHALFGQGGRIGPDLTSYKRDDDRNMLLHIVNPSIEIREGFETMLVITEDGRTASGFLVDQDPQIVTLRGADGQNLTIPREQIEEMLRQPKSLMPEGLLKDLHEQEIRDLFAYLRSGQPLNN